MDTHVQYAQAHTEIDYVFGSLSLIYFCIYSLGLRFSPAILNYSWAVVICFVCQAVSQYIPMSPRQTRLV